LTRKSTYELMYILDVTKGEESVQALIEKFKALIEANGELLEHELIGKRRLAYQINDMPDGYYVLTKFIAPHEFPAEITRIMGITEGVMRSLITKVED